MGDSSSRKALRAQRRREQRERDLVLRHRWYAGGIATLLSAALVFTGMTPAVAEDTPAPVDTTSVQEAATDPSTPPSPSASETSAPTEGTTPPADDATPPADDPTPVDPTPTEPAPTESAAPESGVPVEGEDSADDSASQPESTEAADPPAPQARSMAPDAVIAPLATTSTMDVIVRARVLANPTALTGNQIGNDTSYTVGTVFRLYTYSTYAAGPQAATNYTCTIETTSSPAGQCTIVIPFANVPSAKGGNGGARFWAVQEAPIPGSPAANTYGSASLLLGDYQAPTQRRWIAGLTQAVASNLTNTLPMATATGSGSTAISSGELGNNLSIAEAASFGAVANSLFNPILSPKCTEQQLRIALVLDQSASIDANEWTDYRKALVDNNGVLPLLKSANALVSILGFGSNASTGGNGWRYGAAGPALLPPDYASLVPMTRPGGNANATNWDAALGTIAAANATHDYDMVLFITDGAPNLILGGTQVDGYNVTLRSLEAPIYEANTLKDAGTRVVAVGVGAGITGAGPNLRAVSGATLNSDYFQTSNWTDLKKQLSDIVNEATCQIPIEVSKTTVSASGITTTNAGGWSFSGTKTGGDTGATLAGAATQTTTPGAGGTANWTLGFTQPSGQTATVRLAEQTQSGWTLSGVQCRRGGGDFVPQTVVDGSVTLTGLTTGSGKITCVFTNTENPKTAQVTWSKTDASSAALLGGSEWTITGPGFPAPGVVVVDCTAAGCVGPDKDPVAGQFRLEGLVWGTYTVTESKAPAGYVLGSPAASFTFAVDASNAGTTIAKGAQKNTRATGTVTWSKTDASSAALLGGSE
ncbi:SpaA isopeptide-forming pilin-related protein, partial [Microbacterium lacticum]|uniref:SpaA isopeptide-forming pilin-related protein n=1 Tax=Microbacterium lacticum TaxID=33885 RepID=UPI0028D17C57